MCLLAYEPQDRSTGDVVHPLVSFISKLTNRLLIRKTELKTQLSCKLKPRDSYIKRRACIGISGASLVLRRMEWCKFPRETVKEQYF